jgi:hypothetical protein
LAPLQAGLAAKFNFKMAPKAQQATFGRALTLLVLAIGLPVAVEAVGPQAYKA